MRRARGGAPLRVCGRLAVVLLVSWAATAAADTRPAVDCARVYRCGDGVFCDLRLHDLFPDPIANTLRSGLPVVFDLGLELSVLEQSKARSCLLRSEAAYDVWEDVYSLTRGEETREFGDFETLAAAASLIESVLLISQRELRGDARLALDIRLAISPLSGEERGRMSDWLSRTVDAPGDPDSRELRLNLGGLIGGFFEREPREGAWGGRSELGPWRLADLPERPAADEGAARAAIVAEDESVDFGTASPASDESGAHEDEGTP